MTEKTEQALSTFRSGMNCAQSVLSVYSEQYDLDYNRALSISCGFGGGMGRLQKTCGAVTAAFMVLSLHHCSYDIDPEQKKDYTYKDIRSFNDAFIALHGSTECNELTGYDLKTSEGQQMMKDHRIYETVCERCISNAVSILDSLLSAAPPVSSSRRPGG